jgi:hypothetical protein
MEENCGVAAAGDCCAMTTGEMERANVAIRERDVMLFSFAGTGEMEDQTRILSRKTRFAEGYRDGGEKILTNSTRIRFFSTACTGK